MLGARTCRLHVIQLVRSCTCCVAQSFTCPYGMTTL